MLTYRGRRILFALISEYLATGEPVASAALARSRGLDLSPASVRAVFADLEAQGYLHKPHTSAGRVPTEKGLRVFVDALLSSGEQLPHEMQQALENRFQDSGPGIEAAVKHAGKVLAEFTGAAAIVMTAPGPTWVVRDVRFISVRPDEVLAVIVGANGSVQNRILRTNAPVAPAELERANNLLMSLLEGRTLPEVRQVLAEQLASERSRFDEVVRLALLLAQRALVGVEHEAEVTVEGQAQLIERPEFADIERARQALRTLEDKERLIELLDRTLAAPGIQVLIGSEDEATCAGELSLVAAPFGSGSVGVIGSTRMDYASVVPAVRHTARYLSSLLRTQSGGKRSGGRSSS